MVMRFSETKLTNEAKAYDLQSLDEIQTSLMANPSIQLVRNAHTTALKNSKIHFS